MSAKDRTPVIRTSPRFAELNMNGNIFGGWVLSQMDIAGGITASRRAKGTVATVAIEAMKFKAPVKAGDLVSCYTEIEAVGNTSITVKVDVTATRAKTDGSVVEIDVTEGIFIFVALDKDDRPRSVPKE